MSAPAPPLSRAERVGAGLLAGQMTLMLVLLLAVGALNSSMLLRVAGAPVEAIRYILDFRDAGPGAWIADTAFLDTLGECCMHAYTAAILPVLVFAILTLAEKLPRWARSLPWWLALAQAATLPLGWSLRSRHMFLLKGGPASWSEGWLDWPVPGHDPVTLIAFSLWLGQLLLALWLLWHIHRQAKTHLNPTAP